MSLTKAHLYLMTMGIFLTGCLFIGEQESPYVVQPNVEQVLRSTVIAEGISSYDMDPVAGKLVYSLHTSSDECEIHSYDLQEGTDMAMEIPEAFQALPDLSSLTHSVHCDSVYGARVYLAANGGVYVDSQGAQYFDSQLGRTDLPRVLYYFHENTLVSMTTLVERDYVFHELVLKRVYTPANSEQSVAEAIAENTELYCQDVSGRLKSITQIGETDPVYNILTLTDGSTVALVHQFCGAEEFAGVDREVVSLTQNPSFAQVSSEKQVVHEDGWMTDDWNFSVTSYTDGEGTILEEWYGSCNLFDGGCRNFSRVYFADAWFGGDFAPGGEASLGWPQSLYFKKSPTEVVVLYEESLMILSVPEETDL